MSLDKRFNSDSEWFISPLIDLSTFLAKSSLTLSCFKKEIPAPTFHHLIKEEVDGDAFPANPEKELVDALISRTHCPPEVAKQIFSNDLSIELLRGDDGTNEFGDDTTVYDEMTKLEENAAESSLRTVQLAHLRHSQVDFSAQKKHNYLNEMKYYRYNYEVPLQRGHLNDIHATSADDFVMTCSQPPPNNKIVSAYDIRSTKVLKPAVKFVVRGDTTLLSFRKRIMCPCDMTVDIADGKWLHKPDMNQSHMVIYPSSFIFIHDTFYVDMTKEGCTDTSEPIREFLKKQPKLFGPAKVRSIEGVRFKDLKLRLGQPYVFQHSGVCEHLLIFHDLRLMSPRDEQALDRYPLIAFEKGGEIYCGACKKLFASMVVEDCELLPSSPFFVCECCFKEFLFNPDGTPVCVFRANHYYSFTKLY